MSAGAPIPCGAGGATLVCVRIGEQEFAIDVMSVREIRGWSQPTPLPLAPRWVHGMIDLRGVVIPIVDLGARLGLEAITPCASSVVVVVQIRARLAGLLVDAVCDLIDIDVSRLQAVPETGSPAPGGVVSGILELDGRILSLVELGALLPADLAEAA